LFLSAVGKIIYDTTGGFLLLRQSAHGRFIFGKWIQGIAFSEDGKMAASWSYWDNFVLAWDTATGTVRRKLDIIDGAGLIRLLADSLSSSGDWIVSAFEILVGDNSLYIGGPFHQEFSARFKCDNGMIDCCCVTINTSQDRLCGEILCGDEKYGYGI
jgi:WD40 repeat protein